MRRLKIQPVSPAIRASSRRLLQFLRHALSIVVIFGALSPASVRADASLSLGSTHGGAGSSVSVPLTFGGATNVVALQADVLFDATILSSSATTGGPALGGQTFEHSAPTSGVRRILIYSLNNQPLSAGVIANLQFAISSGAPAGAAGLFLTNVILAGTNALALPATTSSGLITIYPGAIPLNAVPLETLVFQQWDHSFGGLDFDNYPVIRRTLDGGYVLAGATASGVSGNKTTPLCGDAAAWIVKLDAAGNKQWEQTVGAPGSALYVNTIEPTSDGGYALGASSTVGISAVTGNCGKTSANFGGYDFWLVRLDATGQRLWDRSYGGTGLDALAALRQTPDGGFVLSGLSDSPVSGNKTSPHFGGRDMWVVRTDSDGNKLWDQSFGGTADDSAHKGLVLLPDGGFIALGSSLSGVSGNKTSLNFGLSDFWLVRCDSAGNKLWDRSFGGAADDFGTDLTLLSDGSVVLVGQSESGVGGSKSAANYGDNDYWVVRVDAGGSKLWDYSFGGSGYDAAYTVLATADGGVILSGESDSGVSGNRTTPSFGSSDAWVVRLDANGAKLWESPAGSAGYDYFWGAAPAMDGGFTFAGGSDSSPGGNKTSPNRGGEDFWVLHFAERQALVGTPVVLVNGQFHPDNGAVATNSALVQIQTTFANGHIFYTLDGSDPNGGLLYGSPFLVEESVIVSAVAYSSDYAQSAEADSVTIEIVTPPTISQQPIGQVIAAGSMVTFSVLADGTGPLSYHWRLNGTPIPNATNSMLVLPSAQLSDAGDYSVAVANPLGSATSANAFLIVLDPPAVTAQPLSTNVAIGDSAAFCVSASGTPPIRYQWRRNGVNIPGETNRCLTIPVVRVEDGGSYSVVIANPIDVITSEDAGLGLLVPQILAGDNFAARGAILNSSGRAGWNNSPATREPGEPYHAGKLGSNSVWYQWHAFASGAVTFSTSGSTFDTLLAVYTGSVVSALIPIASNDDTTNGFSTSQVRFNVTQGIDYQIAIDGFAGAQGNFVLSWDLTPTPLPSITVQPLDQNAPIGGSVTFSVQASGPGLTYQWFLEKQPLAGQTGPTLTRQPVQESDLGSYKVRISNNLGGAIESNPAISESGPGRSADKFEDLYGLPTPSAPLRIRAGSAAGASFVSVAAGTLQSQIFTTTNSTTQARETNACGVIGGSSRWFLLQAATNGTLVIDTMGSAFDTVLAVYTGSSLSTLTLLDCNNDAAPGVSWSRVAIPAVSGGQYNVVVDGVNAANGTVHLNWGLGAAPADPQPATPLRLLARAAGTLTLRTFATGTPLPGYQWLLNQTNVIGETNAILILTNIQPWQAGAYSVVVSNFFGVLVDAVARVDVDASLLAKVESAFESGAEGWSVLNSAETPLFHAASGNPGGYISATNRYWVAPGKYLGNQSAAYGGVLQFDLKQSQTSEPQNDSDVTLQGGGLTLLFKTDRVPGTNWTSYKVALHELAAGGRTA